MQTKNLFACARLSSNPMLVSILLFLCDKIILNCAGTIWNSEVGKKMKGKENMDSRCGRLDLNRILSLKGSVEWKYN